MADTPRLFQLARAAQKSLLARLEEDCAALKREVERGSFGCSSKPVRKVTSADRNAVLPLALAGVSFVRRLRNSVFLRCPVRSSVLYGCAHEGVCARAVRACGRGRVGGRARAHVRACARAGGHVRHVRVQATRRL